MSNTASSEAGSAAVSHETSPQASDTIDHSKDHTGESVNKPGVEAVFRHLDDPDVPWQHVRQQQNADGTTSSVIEKWFAFSPDPQYLSLYAKYDPGMIVRRHGHYSPHMVFVIEGDVWCGDRHCPAGTHIELPFGAAFGPFRAGENGCTLYECMMGDPRSWGDQPELYENLLAEHGVTPLPDPPIQLPDWLEDLRALWPEAKDAGE